jgi:2-keto-3-deoxy-L-rhamnonate aldolase RhmA
MIKRMLQIGAVNRDLPARPRNRVKQLIDAGQVPIGIECMGGSEREIEMIGWAGFDYVHLDMEHTPFGYESIEQQVRVAESVGMTPIVRVVENDPHAISRVLETGAQGIVIPQVTGPDDIFAALNAMRYAPEGTRGMCPVTRAARFSDQSWEEYLEWARSELLLVPLIENEEALNNLEAICAIPEVKIVGLGSGDLGQSLGVGAQGMSAPVVQEAFVHMVEVAKRTNTVVDGMPVIGGDRKQAVQELLDSGVGMITYDADALMFMRLCQEIRTDIDQVLDSGMAGRREAS